ncbi:TetR/AcrR family transcriptional regulator C-terminal ligand-binding domain-containing protein [Streptomyces flavidovirens]|uniref:TetR/AcrR family transcriptional regulator C-terminal ligand-binding domain-containing protein n=1 Tax=Streptomyces flavidovirens TaxID=67298 RepID=UPI003F5619BC
MGDDDQRTGPVCERFLQLLSAYVAEHSGVHKTTLYCRWGSLEGLVADTLDLAGEDDWTPPDTGSLEGDLRALAREVTDSFSDPAAAATAAARAGAYRTTRTA